MAMLDDDDDDLDTALYSRIHVMRSMMIRGSIVAVVVVLVVVVADADDDNDNDNDNDNNDDSFNGT